MGILPLKSTIINALKLGKLSIWSIAFFEILMFVLFFIPTAIFAASIAASFDPKSPHHIIGWILICLAIPYSIFMVLFYGNSLFTKFNFINDRYNNISRTFASLWQQSLKFKLVNFKMLGILLVFNLLITMILFFISNKLTFTHGSPNITQFDPERIPTIIATLILYPFIICVSYCSIGNVAINSSAGAVKSFLGSIQIAIKNSKTIFIPPLLIQITWIIILTIIMQNLSNSQILEGSEQLLNIFVVFLSVLFSSTIISYYLIHVKHYLQNTI